MFTIDDRGTDDAESERAFNASARVSTRRGDADPASWRDASERLSMVSWRSQLQLARWLGPLTGAEKVPSAVDRRELELPPFQDRPAIKVWRYAPQKREAQGAFLVAPGLHYAGPADPRLDRFLKILARAGYLVWAPFLPDLLDLQVRPTLVDDFGRTLDAMLSTEASLGMSRPALFSISFGSLAALAVASDLRWRNQMGAVICFGGFADFEEVVRFCVNPPANVTHDPLNRPVVMMNLLEHMDNLPPKVDDVAAAWQRYVQRTWGRPAMREGGRWKRVALEEGQALSGAEYQLFLEGVGLDPGGAGAWERCQRALRVGAPNKAFMDPRPAFDNLRVPVHFMHGLDDDVIPWSQLDLLYDALPERVRGGRYLTGLFNHTGVAGDPLRKLVTLAREAQTMMRMVRAIDSAANAQD